MKKRNTYPRLAALSLAVALIGSVTSYRVYASTAAGTEIKNLATISYEDSAGNTYTAQSNEAIVTVAQVYSATINSTDTNLSASPGQPVDIAYTLENTGNGTDTYIFSAANAITGTDDLDADSVSVFEDINSNGQADAGEPSITELILASGEIASIVVRAEVPSNAIANDTIGITLNATAEEGTGSSVAASVTDLTTGKGLDALDSTVETLITVTGDAVIVASKASIHDVSNNLITYTVTIKNNGNSDATSVDLRAPIPTDTTFFSGSVSASGLLSSNGDTEPTTIVLDEATDGIDYNGDGDTADSVPGIGSLDAVLPSNATVTITYSVEYDPTVVPGGTVISNVSYVLADVDNNAGTPDETISTNQTNDIVGSTFLVSISDTIENTGGDGINDGQDDDGANDIQLVNQASSGDAVIFNHVVSNNGNAEDVLELSVQNTSFPAGTVFTIWNDAQTFQLSDSNGQSGVDVGVLQSGESKTISVIAQLPAEFSGTGDFDNVVTVTSATDPTVSDTVTGRLSLINASTIDIHTTATGVANVDDNPIGTPDYAPVSTFTTDINTTVSIPLYIDNDDDASNSYLLTAGSVFNAVNNTVDGLPTGWTVEFFDTDGSGDPTGNPITTTPVIAGQTTNYKIVAIVTVPSDQLKAIDNVVMDNDADGTTETLDQNNDGDGDYPIFFQVSSTNTGASDVTLLAIDVNSVVSASLTPNGFNQVDPGGSETYQNTLINNGNATETFTLAYSHSQQNWSSVLTIDTDGDGVADTGLENLTAGPIQVAQPDGTVATIDVTIGGGGAPEFTLDASEALPFDATIFAPANALNGEVDTFTITATNVVTSDVASAQNQSQIVTGKVRIDKVAALDTNCDGNADTSFAAAQPTTVEPDQCVIWRMVAENRGANTAFNVQVRDAAPSFTTYVAGSLSYCLNLNCTLATVTDNLADDAGEISSGDIAFYIGNGATPASGIGGELISGEQATVQFSVRID